MLILFLAFSLCLFFSPAWCVAADNCIGCHTSPGKLIKVIRELDKPKIEPSTETKGEG